MLQFRMMINIVLNHIDYDYYAVTNKHVSHVMYRAEWVMIKEATFTWQCEAFVWDKAEPAMILDVALTCGWEVWMC